MMFRGAKLPLSGDFCKKLMVVGKPICHDAMTAPVVLPVLIAQNCNN
jgi:hypothetical protein